LAQALPVAVICSSACKVFNQATPSRSQAQRITNSFEVAREGLEV